MRMRWEISGGATASSMLRLHILAFSILAWPCDAAPISAQHRISPRTLGAHSAVILSEPVLARQPFGTAQTARTSAEATELPDGFASPESVAFSSTRSRSAPWISPPKYSSK